MDRFRLDKWLWAARLYKTRALAAEDIERGRVSVNAQLAKASRELREGDLIELRQPRAVRTFVVRALSRQRGPAPDGAGALRRNAGERRPPRGARPRRGSSVPSRR